MKCRRICTIRKMFRSDKLFGNASRKFAFLGCTVSAMLFVGGCVNNPTVTPSVEETKSPEITTESENDSTGEAVSESSSIMTETEETEFPGYLRSEVPDYVFGKLLNAGQTGYDEPSFAYHSSEEVEYLKFPYSGKESDPALTEKEFLHVDEDYPEISGERVLHEWVNLKGRSCEAVLSGDQASRILVSYDGCTIKIDETIYDISINEHWIPDQDLKFYRFQNATLFNQDVFLYDLDSTDESVDLIVKDDWVTVILQYDGTELHQIGCCVGRIFSQKDFRTLLGDRFEEGVLYDVDYFNLTTWRVRDQELISGVGAEYAIPVAKYIKESHSLTQPAMSEGSLLHCLEWSEVMRHPEPGTDPAATDWLLMDTTLGSTADPKASDVPCKAQEVQIISLCFSPSANLETDFSSGYLQHPVMLNEPSALYLRGYEDGTEGWIYAIE